MNYDCITHIVLCRRQQHVQPRVNNTILGQVVWIEARSAAQHSRHGRQSTELQCDFLVRRRRPIATIVGAAELFGIRSAPCGEQPEEIALQIARQQRNATLHYTTSKRPALVNDQLHADQNTYTKSS